MIRSVILLLLTVIAARADVFILDHADRLRHREYGGRQVRELIGHVQVRYAELTIQCDEARYYELRRELVCSGRVQVDHHQRTLTAERMVYYEQDDRLEAINSVRMIDGDLEATAERGTYLRDEEVVILKHEVQLLDRANDAQLLAEEVEYNHRTGLAFSEKKPVLVLQHEQEGAVRLNAHRVQSERWQHRHTATGDVHLFSENLRATGDTLVYSDSLHQGDLFGSPELIQDTRTIRGNRVYLETSGEYISYLRITGEGLVTSPADSVDANLENELAGDTLHFYFKEKTLQKMVAAGNARSVYFVRNEDGSSGVNMASGNRLKFAFVDDELKQVETEQGARGRYIPIRKKENADGTVESP